MKKITILGGGFSGLTLSLELAKRGFEVELHEKSSRLGGLIQTRDTHDGLVETAANALLWSKNLESLCNELDLSLVKAQKVSERRYFFRRKPTIWPLGLFESMGFLFSLLRSFITGKLRASIPAQETIQTWATSRLGSAATELILAPALQGIYAGDIKTMSANLILGPLLKRKRTGYRGSVSGAQGMQDVINALEKKIRHLGVRIHLNSDVPIETLARPLVITTSAATAARLTQNSFPQLSQQLQKIKMAPLISVTCFWKKKNAYRGFGCLIPRHFGIRTLGVLMNTYIFPGRDKNYSETFILGGATDPQISKLSDLEIHQLVLKDRQQIFKENNELLSLHITRWPEALPQYDIELEKLLPQIKLPTGLYLHGNYLGQIGLSKILDRSVELAQQIEGQYV